jgi:hypothetical protein
MILIALILGGFLLLSAGWFMHRYADDGNATDVTGWPLRIAATVFLLGMVVASQKIFGVVVTLFIVRMPWPSGSLRMASPGASATGTRGWMELTRCPSPTSARAKAIRLAGPSST